LYNEIIVTGIIGGIDPSIQVGAEYDFVLTLNGATISSQTTNSNTPNLSFAGLAAGNYVLTVTDDDNCSASVNITVNDGITLTDNSAQCAMGNLDLNISGGPSAASFTISSSIDGSLGTTTAGNFTQNNLTPGTHTITLSFTDNGQACDETIDIDITNGIAITLDDDECSFATVSLTSITGGLDPSAFAGNDYTIELLDGATVVDMATISTNSAIDVFTNVPAGTYDLSITDAGTCTLTQSITIYDAISVVNATADCDYASVALSISGGEPDFTNNLSAYTVGSSIDGALGNADNTGAFAAILSEGTHTLTIAYPTASGNCFEELTVEVFADIEVLVEENCNFGEVVASATGGYSGANFTPINGNSDYTYNLYMTTAPPVNTTIIDANNSGVFTNVAPGDYFVEVIDGNLNVTTDCSVVEGFTVLPGDPLAINADTNCGIIEAMATGGGGSFTYSISPNTDLDGNPIADNTTGIFENLAGGTYTVTATDANDCPISADYTIATPIIIQGTEFPCWQGITVTGGTGTLTYEIYTADSTTLLATNQTGVFTSTSGPYYLVVYDDFNCTADALITCTPALDCDEISSTAQGNCQDQFSYEVVYVLNGFGPVHVLSHLRFSTSIIKRFNVCVAVSFCSDIRV